MNTIANLAIVTGHVRRVAAVTVISVGLFALAAAAQTAKDVKGATPLVAVPNEPAVKLVVDPPIPEQLAQGRVFIQYRTENLRILPVFGSGGPGSLAARRTPALLRRRPVVAHRRHERRNGCPRRIETGTALGPARAGGRNPQTDPGGQPGRGVYGPAEVAGSLSRRTESEGPHFERKPDAREHAIFGRGHHQTLQQLRLRDYRPAESPDRGSGLHVVQGYRSQRNSRTSGCPDARLETRPLWEAGRGRGGNARGAARGVGFSAQGAGLGRQEWSGISELQLTGVPRPAAPRRKCAACAL
jgi:hypothetical protein